MELQPDGDERRQNKNLSGFAKDILDNDLFAMAVVARGNKSAPQGDGWQYRAGEPSLSVLDDGKFSAGIQLGYLKENLENRSRASRYVYTDFFIFDPTTGAQTVSDELAAVIDGIDTNTADELIEEAWQLWLTLLHSMVDRINATPKEGFVVGKPDAMKLFIDRQTGEIAFGYNIPPDNAVEIQLPPLGQPFKN